ncbi:MAG: rod shape-determining protein MreC [Gammaproteobacteria bacterium]|nr:rod shape-determining protein MreC [Gammaproteobacteria bacterium]
MRLLKPLLPALIAIILIVLDARFSYLDNLKRNSNTLLTPIYFLVDLPAQMMSWVSDKGSDTDQLISENEQLTNELFELKAKLQIYNNLVLENQKISRLIDASYTLPANAVKLARIKSISQSRLKRQLVINKGSNDNILTSQIVLGANGIVGQVIQSTPLYATVQLTTDPTQHIPVKNIRNGARGITKGLASNESGMKVEFMPSATDVKLGDIFVTSGIGGTYPSGYPVGEVIEVSTPHNEAFLLIRLKPLEDMNTLEFVLVVSEPL